MITKHFLKTLLLFTLMIGLGLLFVFVVSSMDGVGGSDSLNTANVAK